MGIGRGNRLWVCVCVYLRTRELVFYWPIVLFLHAIIFLFESHLFLFLLYTHG